ncbi:MAG: FAD binding domain-containing protein [Dehalococcoidia bacterium]|nr:FAD binding domain-containing protein [Dehalococcoidia bacterium]
MKLPRIDYLEANTVQEACALLASGDVLPVAGGTDLVPSLKHHVKTPKAVVNLKAIRDLNYITYGGNAGLKIGALVTLRDLQNNAAVKSKYPALVQAAASVGTVQLQNMGTVAGNLCLDTRCYYYNQSNFWRSARPACYKAGGDVCHVVKRSDKCWACYSGDTAPAFMVLGAQVKVTGSKGERLMSLAKLYSGDGKKPVALAADELVTEIQVPALAANSGSGYMKLRIRKAIDFPLLGAAVWLQLDGKVVKDIRVALTAADSAPIEVEGVAKSIQGKPYSEDNMAEAMETSYKKAKPVDNVIGGSPPYRKKMARVFVKRAANLAVQQAQAK